MRVFIGVAWPYASGPRHLGHLAGAYLPADVVARYHRIAGDDVLMVSGSDQHGTPITVAAERARRPPEKFADEQHELIKASFERVGISFEIYTRTTTEVHRRTTQSLFTRLFERGLVTDGLQKGAWCRAEGRSIPDRYVEGTCPRCGSHDARGDQCDACGSTLDPEDLEAPRCSRCGEGATIKLLRQLFFRLDRLQSDLEAYVRRGGSRWRPFVERETSGWLREGLRPRAITRDLPWGVEVPLDGWEDRRLYVWFDAVIGYLSASIEWAGLVGDEDGWHRWWRDDQAVHKYFIGKDNVPFHTLWLPAILYGAAAGLHLPDEVVANHYLTTGSDKMSASRGVGFAIDEAVSDFGVDPLRHALCALNPETDDVEFDFAAARELTRTGLLGAIANPCYRVFSLFWSRFGGLVDERAWTDSERDHAAAAAALESIGSDYAGARLRSAVRRLHELGRIVNRRLAATEPWHLLDEDAHSELTRLLPYIAALGVAAHPVVPATASRLRTSLGLPAEPEAWSATTIPPRLPGPPEPPLPKVEPAGRR